RRLLPLDAGTVIRLSSTTDPNVAADTRDAELLDRRRTRLNRSYKLLFRQPLHVVRANGVWVYDADGRAYLDAYNNVVSLGHGNPEVVAAVAGQTARLNTHTRYLTDEVVDY